MSEEIKKLGELFQVKRKELNLSLKEVENSTSIRVNYLQAIEQGEINRFLSSVYTTGFIKQYANFLGFDGEKIIQDHGELFQKKGEKQEFAYGIGTLEVRGNTAGGVKWLPNLIWTVIFVVVVPIIAYYVIKYFGWI